MEFLLKSLTCTAGVVIGLFVGSIPITLVVSFPPGLAKANPWVLLGCTIAFTALPILGFVVGSQIGLNLYRRYRRR